MNDARAVYVHIPFCRSICFYCGFCRQAYQKELADSYLTQLAQEISAVLSTVNDYQTFYLGGGTPSCLSGEQLEKVLQFLRPYSTELAEYTIEFNPEDLTKEKIELLAKYNINRVSIGVQSTDNSILASLNRQHDLQTVEAGIKRLLEAGISDISIDLIYGLPTQSLCQWQQTLKEALRLPLKHISLYSLTIEENSVFGKQRLQKISDELEADMYEYACNYLQQSGFTQYETSNFSLPGFQSQHNLAYWNYDNFIGLGVAASGKSDNYRYTNTENLSSYREDYRSKIYYHLQLEEQIFEFLMMNLRKTTGFELKEFTRRFGSDFLSLFPAETAVLSNDGLVEIENGFLKTTERGGMLLHEVLLTFLAD